MPPRKRAEQGTDAPSGADQASPSPSAPDVRSDVPSAEQATDETSAAQCADARRTTRPGLRLRRGDRRDRFREKSEATA